MLLLEREEVRIMAEYKRDDDVQYCLAEYYDEFARIPMDLLNMICDLDSIDIIRCSECKHWEAEGVVEGECNISGLKVIDIDYCSRGEIKGNSNE